jgi:membrane protein
MKLKTQDVKSLIKKTFSEWSSDKAPKMAAAMAYYAVFSMGPLLLIAVSVASLFFGEQAARGELLSQISGLIGPSAAQAISGMLKSVQEKQATGITAVVGIGTLLATASGVFAELQDSLNQIWNVRPAKSVGFTGMIKKRLLSFGMVFSIGFLLLVSLVLTSMLELGLKYVGDLIPGAQVVWQIVSFLVSFSLVTALFAAMFRYLPDAKIAWRDLWIGSAITSALFTLGKFGISLYLAHSATASAFGAAASLVILLLWIYYSAQIFFFGAEFTRIYANTYGLGIIPRVGATKVTRPPEQSLNRKDFNVNSFSKNKNRLKSFDDAIKSVNDAEQPLKNEMVKTKLTLSNLLKARKYYIIGSTIVAAITYLIQMRRRKNAEAH